MRLAFRFTLFFSIFFALVACSGGTDEQSVTLHEGQSWSLLNSSHGGDGSAWGLGECENCHVLALIHPKRSNIKQIVRDKGYGTCEGCHGQNGTNEARQCLVCHNTIDLPEVPAQANEAGQKYLLSHDFKHDEEKALNDQNCISCHESSDMDGQFELQTDLTRFTDHHDEYQPYLSQTDFCLRCHNQNNQQAGFEISDSPLSAIADHYNFIDWHGEPEGSGQRVYSGLREGHTYQSVVECTDCHAMHGTHNAKLIIPKQLIPPATSEASQTRISVTVENDDYSQLCVSCHAMDIMIEQGAEDTGNGLSGVHVTGTECRSCHQHGMPSQVGL